MKTALKKALLAASFSLNALFALLFLLAALSPGKIRTVRFLAADAKALPYLHSALILSVPAEGAEVNFGPAEFLLKKGSAAALQLSFVRDGSSQSNLALEPLYDPSVVSIRHSGYGLFVTGIRAGETTVQIFSGGSFRDLAHVVVYDPSMPDE